MKQNLSRSDLFCKCNLNTSIQHFQFSVGGFVVEASKKRGEFLALFTVKKIGFDTFMAETVNMTYGKSIYCI